MAPRNWCFPAYRIPTKTTCGCVARVSLGFLVLYVVFLVSFEEEDTNLEWTTDSLKGSFVKQTSENHELVSLDDAQHYKTVDEGFKGYMNATNVRDHIVSPTSPRNGTSTFLSSAPPPSDTHVPNYSTSPSRIDKALLLSTSPKISNKPTSLAPTTSSPTPQQTALPTTIARTPKPTLAPTTNSPTLQQTVLPTTVARTQKPTLAPTTNSPTLQQTVLPTTVARTPKPTLTPMTSSPTLQQTVLPTTVARTPKPTLTPTTSSPTLQQTVLPTTVARTQKPTLAPTTSLPTLQQTVLPTTVARTPKPTNESSYHATNETSLQDSVESLQILDTAWSTHPRTPFTDHILDIIFNLDLDKPQTKTPCSVQFNFTVQKPYSTPNISSSDQNEWIWTGTLKRIFASKILPYNLTFGGIHLGDFLDSNMVAHKACLGNSAEWGKFCVPNMEELKEMVLRDADHDDPKRFQWSYIHNYDMKPWDERNSTPIFRGTARSQDRTPLSLCTNPEVSFDTLLQAFPKRFYAVAFSMDHPDLLDARFNGIDWIFDTCVKYNVTNGLSKVLSLDPINPIDYYADRQVALVLAGIGAAFRMSTHFLYGTAVVLQSFKYVEWYTPYLEPFVHYIPLSEDLHDLEQVLLWVKGHPKEVKQIAENGRAFYEKYLTFYKHEEHIYELLYTLSEYSHFRSLVQHIDGNTTSALVNRDINEERSDSKGAVIISGDAAIGTMEIIASWSDHPRTQFTDHILDIIFNLDLDRPKTLELPCSQHYDLIVQNPYSIPNITCKDVGANDWIWCGTMRRIFASKVLPYNLTSVGFHLGDYMDSEFVAHKYCLGNSAEWGKYCVPNMEDLSDMELAESAHDNPEQYQSKYYRKSNKSWEERSSMPIFRGTARSHPEPRTPLNLCDNPTVALDTLLQAFPKRFAAVVFSADHPDLLDAKFSSIDGDFDTCMKYNATNGLSKVVSIERMDPVDYFSDRQVALVLAGIGAAFRMSTHLQYGTAVVLQTFKYVEWYTPYMKPYVHYIPVSEDLHDLEQVLLWVKGHPKEVKQIAENGRAFYEKYLTFYKHEEHIYELLYRLSEYTQFRRDQGLLFYK